MNIDNAVLKSLVDKNISSINVNPTLVINKQNKDIKDKVKRLLSESKRVDIAISYVVWSGLSLIYEELKKMGSDSRLVLTIEGLVTDIKSLRKLLELDMQVKVFAPTEKRARGFHLKSYLFEQENSKTLLVGSANISSRAFGLAHEMAVEINAKDEGQIIDEYSETFEELWLDQNSVSLSLPFIEQYNLILKEEKNTQQEVNKLLFNYNAVAPNHMQKKALEELTKCREECNKGLVIAATGTGKTYLSAFDVKQARAKKVLFLVHNRLILTSAIETYEKVFPDSTIIELKGTNISDLEKADFTFTTDKTALTHLVNEVDKKYFDYIIYDEAHKVGAGTNYDTIINYFNPDFSLGITATPERTDDPRYLFEKFEYNVPYEIRLLDAMNSELVCPFTYYGLNLDDRLLNANEEFNYIELAKFIKHQIDTKSHYGEKLKCIIFCSNIKEATNLSTELKKVGYQAATAVSSDGTTRETVEKYINSLKSDDPKSIEIICTVNKFNEGVDIPDINMIVMLRNTTSAIIYLQQLGRGLRRTEDIHKYVTVLDIIGNSNKCYSIAQVLTGNETVDKRLLYKHTQVEFSTVSQFINVEIEEKAMENIIKSISNNFTVKNQLKQKFKNELSRYEKIPSLIELYTNPNFRELELLQLLDKNFYDPFESYYSNKYGIEKDVKFISDFFSLITQFVFRSYTKETLKKYVKLLKGEKITDSLLARILAAKQHEDGIATSINSEYYKSSKNYPEIFTWSNNELTLNEEINDKLQRYNALELFKEHIELFDHLSENKIYTMHPFDLVTKGEFLLNTGAKDCYMNAIGERIDNEKKVLYCTIKVSKNETHYDNYIIDDDKIVYHTQNSRSKESAIKKINKIVNENYQIKICAQFPHLGYSNTAYFNLDEVEIEKVSEVRANEENKFNHEITLKLKNKIPKELLQYKL